MKREYLKELGLEDEMVNKIMAEHGNAITAAKPTDYDDLKGAKETLEKQVEELNGKYADYDNNLGQLQSKVKEYEVNTLKTRIAIQVGIPVQYADRLRGETEEELKADAELLAPLTKQPALPLKGTEPNGKSKDNDEDLREMVQKLNGMGD